MQADKPTDIENDLDEEPGEEVESAPPLRVGEEQELGSSGIKKKLLKRGRGWETPGPGDEATVHYVGTLLDGTKFESTRDKDEPLTIKLGNGQVTSGVDDGIITMTKGEIALFTLPAEKGYGVDGRDDVVPPNSVVRFEIELISWISVVDVSKDGGIIKKVMEKGQRNGGPGYLDEVLVKYRVELVDGTIVAETPEEGVEFYVKDGHLCPALPKAVVTMERGEKARLIVQPQYAFRKQGRDASEGFHSIPQNSVLNIDVELVSFKPVIDVTGDAKVFKKILKEGEDALSANEGATVTITYMGRLEDGTVFEKKGIDGETPLNFVTDEEQVITGLDIAAATMKKGERAVLTIHPDYGFGNVEVRRDLAVVPPSSTLTYEVEMLDCIKEKAPWQMNNNERIEAAGKKKEEGNLLFKSGKYQRAAKKYDKAAEYVSEEISFGDDVLKLAKPLRLSCWLNGVACSLKLNDFQGAIELCSKVLDVEFHNVKALYRRAQAYMGNADLILAELDIKKALEADPENREVKLIQRNLKQLQVESNKRDAKLYANMFARTPIVTKKLKVDKTENDRKDEEIVSMEVENVAHTSHPNN
ncbi:Peptidyl-prolyl cis-trans isomerase FKBP65 [Morus notabilis]|uniref:peptidylprolyl isomerase n=1 Tax=Morus notabilis TaxID=981085 RepID=W9SDX2_9ROSA|nr:70 kDa peptidyl-prolyl isomerase [Morus notabilis]EXC36632.1 Peptidyl-prolyl cis-trans isomerase FKBP65 [Morus notabilis]